MPTWVVCHGPVVTKAQESMAFRASSRLALLSPVDYVGDRVRAGGGHAPLDLAAYGGCHIWKEKSYSKNEKLVDTRRISVAQSLEPEAPRIRNSYG